jgi:hypothetical protein
MGRAESAVQQILRWLCLVQATLFIFFATATGTGIVSAYLHFLLSFLFLSIQSHISHQDHCKKQNALFLI